MKRIKSFFVVLGVILGLFMAGTGTSSAGTGPSIWEFGSSGNTCTGTPIYITPASAAQMDCLYYEGTSTFQLGGSGSTLEYKPSGGGNLIGWFDDRTRVPNYWLTSHTTSGSSTSYDMVLQHDCNIVIYPAGKTGSVNALWATGSQTSDPNRDGCRIRMASNHFFVDFYNSGTNSWWTQCSVPNGYFGATCNIGPRNT